MAENATRARTQSDAILQQCIRDTNRCIANPTPHIRLLKQKLDKLYVAIDDLQEKHIVFADKTGADIESEPLQTWINPKLDVANELADKVFVMIEELEQLDESEKSKAEDVITKARQIEKQEGESKILEKRIKITENIILEKIQQLDAIVQDEEKEDSKKEQDLVRSHLKEIESFMEEQTKSWNELQRLSGDNQVKLDEIFENERKLRKSVSDARLSASAFVGVEEEVKERSKESESSQQTSSKLLDIQKMSPPIFNGDIRAFAKFKADFITIVEPKYPDKTHQAYILKRNCLKGEAKNIVENISDVKKIWERLHDRFGNEQDIVNTVLEEVNNLSTPKNNPDQGFVNLVNTIEKGLQDLEIIGAEEEIMNTYTVNLLEGKISKRVLSKWYDKEREMKEKLEESTEEKDKKVSGKKRFEWLLKFLKEERRQTERVMVLKPSSTPPADHSSSKRGGDGKLIRGIGAGAALGQQPVDPQQKKFNNNCLVHPEANHLTRKCRKFLSMSVVDRGTLVKNTGGCKLCLSLSHVGQVCPFEGTWTCSVTDCTDPHSFLVHGCGIQGISLAALSSSVKSAPTPSRKHVLLLIQKVKTETGYVITFWDNGSTIALISSECVRRLKLLGVPVVYDLTTVGGVVTTHESTLHEITLIDKNNQKHFVTAYEIPDICGEVGSIKVNGVMHLFPSTKIKEVERCSGKIEMLVGMEYASLHPKPVTERENLVLYRSLFGTGKVLGGTHPAVTSSDTMSAATKRTASAQICNVRIGRLADLGVDFFTSEGFGVNVPPRCKRCTEMAKRCRECRFEIHELSRNSQQELAIMKENAVLDPIKKQWTTKYAFNSDPTELEDNYEQAVNIMKKQEDRMLKKNKDDIPKYCEQFQDLLDRGVLEEITEADRDKYEGPSHYVSMLEVYKEDSASTPVRLVINSSLKFKGQSLNDKLIRGPNSLNNIFGIQLRFRTHTHGLVCDLRKMYHTIHTTEVEKHLRRVVFRFFNKDEKPKVYGPTRVMFGDRPAAAISSICIRETAEIYQHVDEEAARIIKEDMYVDDLASGAETEADIARLKVKVTDILGRAGFEIKGFVASYDDSPDVLALLGTGEVGRVLGIYWDAKNDQFAFIVHINLSKKVKGAHFQSDLTEEQIPRMLELVLTRRIILSIVYTFYDPLGILCIIIIQLKIELRNLYRTDLNLGWDDPIPADMKATWVRLFQLLKSCEKVRFPRCIRPRDAVGLPELVLFNDASKDAMCTAAYLRWSLSNGSFESCLWAAKTRVTPLLKDTIPRSEMKSCVMSTRLGKDIKENGGLEVSKTTYILDSSCTLALLKKDSGALKEFMGNKVSEVLQTATPDQFFHVKSADNIADLGTRMDATPADADLGSEWQCGPSWLKLDFKDWPVSQDTSSAEIPLEEVASPNIVAAAAAFVNSPFIDTERFKNRYKGYDFFIKLVALLVKCMTTKSFHIQRPYTVDELNHAEHVCVKLSMKLTLIDFNKGLLRSLQPRMNDEGIVVIQSRAVEGLKLHYGSDQFPIITYRDPFAHMWIKKIHEENHTGITSTVAKSRRKYWVVRGRILAKKIKNSCYRCRITDKKMAEQLMGPLPEFRLTPSPPFYTTSLDLFGPKLIKDTVKGRTKKKVWGVLFTCAVTRAVFIDLSEDYSTDTILQAIQRFTDVRGCPSEFLSDRGSQLVAAAADIVDMDWTPVENWCLESRIKWTLAPAEGQHMNGLSESLIRSTKRSLENTIGDHTLTFSELQTVLYNIANIINSRPIGIVNDSDPSHPTPITPNDLLLGRASNDPPKGPFDTNKSTTRRYRFTQELVTSWWDIWFKTVLPSLVPSYKWLQRHRNVCVGDVCLIRYGKDKRATYRLGRVTEVKDARDGLVRKVTLSYKLPNEKNFRYVERPIHSIAVIVPVEEQSETQQETDLNPKAQEFVPQN